jgi:uncharacterized membrane protein YphA (DoxX/SURF4 family)
MLIPKRKQACGWKYKSWFSLEPSIITNARNSVIVTRRKTMNIVLWVVQILLAIAFLGAGIMKVTQPVEKLKTNMGWVTHTTPGIVRLVGALEILGAIGLILPAVIHILPWLTAVAAIGLVLTMIVAIIIHFRLHEASRSISPLILLLLALFIVIGRFAIVPLS